MAPPPRPSPRADPALAWASDRCLRVAWDDEEPGGALVRVVAACEALRGAGVPALLDVVPAYAALLLVFDLALLDPGRAESHVRRVLAAAAARETGPGRLVTVPACFDAACGPDADDVARLHGLTRDEVVRAFADAEYRVAFLGFAPGFPYLTGLPARLATPRLARPRQSVPAGSLGLAEGQAGVYPQATPGGWRLLGRTPLVLFDPQREPAALLAPGDRVRFVALAHAELAGEGAR